MGLLETAKRLVDLLSTGKLPSRPTAGEPRRRMEEEPGRYPTYGPAERAAVERLLEAKGVLPLAPDSITNGQGTPGRALLPNIKASRREET